ncbi:MAG: glycosyltransferase, partial [Desulfobulbales bacterium]|nr:glycosyltransferase [Desulfobulbales bacterium]
MAHSSLKRQTANDVSFRYSVIIPSYNEESFLPETLAKLKLAMQDIPHQGEIIVVDNNSTDRTAEIAQANGTRVVFEPERQISRARNSGAGAAKSDWLIFLDADTILSASLLNNALTHLKNGTCCGGGTLLDFDTQLPFLAGRLVSFWNWLSRTRKLAAGSFIFCLREAFIDTGGFDEKTYAGEEVFFSRKLQRWGKKHDLPFIILADQHVVTSSRKFHWYSSMQITGLLLMFTVFPFALRSRTL